MFRYELSIAGLLMSVLLGGCAALPPAPSPQETPWAAQPRTPPMRSRTMFSDAMACMDDLFLRYGVEKKYIGAVSLPDQTGADIGGGNLSALMSAISEMNRRSDAFQFVYLPVTFSGNIPNAETGRIDVVYLMRHIKYILGDKADVIDMPDYLLVASVSGLDRNVAEQSGGGGLDLSRIGLGVSGARRVSVMTTDVNVAEGQSDKILNGMNATNQVAIVDRGAGADLDASFEGAGGYFSFSLDHAEGQHAALRNLIQLSTIETLGKLARVPYQQCLVQKRAAPRAVARSGVAALTLTAAHGGKPRWRLGDKLKVRVTTSRAADVFCYYQSAKEQIWQVFPTRFQPRPTLGAERTATIPGTPRFDLVLDTAPARERVMCLAAPPGTAGAIAKRLPGSATRTDLQPLAAASLDAIEEAYLRIAPNDIARADLEVRVE